jgi:cytochrome c1
MVSISSGSWRVLVPVAMVIASLAVAGCGGGGGSQPPTTAAQGTASTKPAAAGDPQAVQQAIAKYGCGACHVIPGVQGANGTNGPSLAGFSKLDVIAKTTVPNTPENDVKWIMDPQSIKPGTAMPNKSVNQTDAQTITAYLRTLQ